MSKVPDELQERRAALAHAVCVFEAIVADQDGDPPGDEYEEIANERERDTLSVLREMLAEANRQAAACFDEGEQ